jgi:undecaprenyl-diphosphatase
MGDLNGSIFDGINQLAGHATLVDDSMKFAAQYVVFLIVAFAALSLFVRAGGGEQRRIAVYTAALAVIPSLIIVAIVQHFYVHQRPFVVRSDVVLLIDHGADASFPSEHATVAFAVAAGIGVYRRRFGLVLLVLACLVAFSRVYVGVHYPGDVAGGAIIGIAMALGLRLAYPVLLLADDFAMTHLVPAPIRRFV